MDTGTRKGGVIVFMDRLGVKGSWATGEPGEALESWKWTMGLFRRAIEQETGQLAELVGARTKVVGFSDTIIAILDCGPRNDYWNYIHIMVNAVVVPFTMAMYRRVFLRGAISIGEFYQSDEEDIIIGPAVDDAHEWHDKADWMGVVLTPSAQYGIARRSEAVGEQEAVDDHKNLHSWMVPMRDGSHRDLLAVDWPNVADKAALHYTRDPTTQVPPSYQPRGLLLEAFAGGPIAPSMANKYEKTLYYFNERTR